MNSSLIENKVDMCNLDKYAAILGESPSKGARSPKLWNAVFKFENLNYKMLPIDVGSKNIVNLLDNLNTDKKFIGGAIAVPYKELVAKWLGNNITPEAKKNGVVNCLYRDLNGNLHGTNTDGEASLTAFINRFGPVESKKILILGLGGVGKSVSAYFALKSSQVIVATRSNSIEYAKKIGARWVDWSQLDTVTAKQDIIINCTSIGYGSQENSSPLNIEQIESFAKSTIVYDVVYQPLETRLLAMSKGKGLTTFNGLDMNMEQAVLAYQYAVDTNLTTEKIKNIMSNIN